MLLGARLAVNTHNMGGRFEESLKNARWSMNPQKVGDGLKNIVEFQVQIKGHNQREYENKWQGWQNWTGEKLATKLTKDNQQPVSFPPAKWWPGTLPEFEGEGWWQRPQSRVTCKHCRGGCVEIPSLRSNKCHGCEKQMQTKGKRLDGISGKSKMSLSLSNLLVGWHPERCATMKAQGRQIHYVPRWELLADVALITS